jgi:Transcriptional regulators of sugar metabolism
MSKKSERMNQIIDILKTKNGDSIKDLAIYFNVSEMTIRRDVDFLCQEGIVKNLYGAVILNPKSTKAYHLTAALTSHFSEKDKIGKFAASLVVAGDTLIIDTGSTTEYIAKHLPLDLPLTVLCYNYNVLSYLLNKPNIKLIFPGGFYHSDTQMFESKEARALIHNTRATKAFISAAGVHESMGVTCVNGYEVDNKQEGMQSSFERILTVDSSKFSVIQSAYFAQLQEFNTIITDSNISEKWMNLIQELGITLHIV